MCSRGAMFNAMPIRVLWSFQKYFIRSAASSAVGLPLRRPSSAPWTRASRYEKPNRMNRRHFVQLLVAGAAAAATAPVSAVARAQKSAKAKGATPDLHRPETAAVRNR